MFTHSHFCSPRWRSPSGDEAPAFSTYDLFPPTRQRKEVNETCSASVRLSTSSSKQEVRPLASHVHALDDDDATEQQIISRSLGPRGTLLCSTGGGSLVVMLMCVLSMTTRKPRNNRLQKSIRRQGLWRGQKTAFLIEKSARIYGKLIESVGFSVSDWKWWRSCSQWCSIAFLNWDS